MTRWAGCGLIALLIAAVGYGQTADVITEITGFDPLLRPNPFGGGPVPAAPQFLAQRGPLPPGAPPRDREDGEPGPPNTRPIRPVYTEPGPPKLDRHGDPLPAGALARYGTVRLRHGTDISGIGFTPDSKLLCTVSASEDTVRVWNPTTGKEVARLNIAPTLVSLAKDGSVYVIDGDRVRVWLPTTNTTRTLPGKPIPEGTTPTAIAVNPDGRSFTLGFEGKLLILDAQTGKTVRELKLPDGPQNNGRAKGGGQPNGQPGPPPTRLLYSPDGRWLAGNGQKTGVWLWDLRTGKRVRTYRSDFDFPEYTFSPDVTKIAVTGQRFHLYPLDSEEPVEGFKSPENGDALLAPRFSADGKTLYAINGNGDVWPFDAATGEASEPLDAPVMNLHAPFALSPGGTTAAGIDETGGIRIWDTATGKGPGVERVSNLSSPGFALDGKQVTALDAENKIRAFDPATGLPGKTVELPGEDIGLPATWDAASRRAAVLVPSGDDLEIQVIDADTGKAVSKHAVANAAGIPFVSFAAANRDRMVMFSQTTIAVANPTTGKAVRTIDIPNQNNGARGGIAPDGRSVVMVGQPATIWEVATGKKRLTLDAIQAFGVFSPDSRFVGGWDETGNLVVMDARTGAVVRRFPSSDGQGGLGTMAFSPDGKRLATGTDDGRVTVWDVTAGEALAPFGGHDGIVTGLAFSPDGKRLVSTASDGTALVWAVPEKALTVGPADAAVSGFEEAFRLLGSADAQQAQRGLDYIYRNPNDAPKQAGQRLPAPTATPAATVTKHIEDLGSDEFATREAAKKALEAIGGEAGPALKRAMEKSPSSEVRKTAAELLGKIDAPASRPDDLRILRAVEAMENLRSADGRAQLEKWALGPPGHRLTIEAADAVARLKATGGK